MACEVIEYACFENTSQGDTRNRIIAFYKNRINKQSWMEEWGVAQLYVHFIITFICVLLDSH